MEQKIKPDVVYSVTAPSYFSFETTEVMRFTNPLVTHPNKYSKSTQTLKERIKTWLYCKNQIRLMKKAHFFITQTETTKQGILRITGEPENHVRVVNNVLPSVFKNMDNTPIVEDDRINIACVGNPVPHKNFDILPDVLSELKKLGIENICFHTTIPLTILEQQTGKAFGRIRNDEKLEESWQNISEGIRSNVSALPIVFPSNIA